MRTTIIAAERAREVREAARAWRHAGFMGEVALSRVLALYPDDRRRFGPGFRVLAFIFTSIAVWAMVGLSFVIFEPDLKDASIFVFWGLLLFALTELQRGPWARADAGAESATALIAAIMAIVAGTIGAGGSSDQGLVVRLLASAGIVCLAAAWHWGDAFFFLGASLSGYGLLAQAEHGRLWWLTASSLLFPIALAAARDGSRSPSHRRGAVIVGAVAVLALYAAVQIWSLDQRLIEDLSDASLSPTEPSPTQRSLAILATALLPLGLLVSGWRRREPLLLYSGLLLIGASIATIRLYREVMPLSLALILIGGSCLGLALGARRWLRSGEGGERGGFTSDPLFDRQNRTEAIRSVVAMASFAPAAATPTSRKAFEGGGGTFGGGGASGNY